MSLQIVVDGQWLGAHTTWGDLEWSTVWPGGSESLTFTAARSHRLLHPDALVELWRSGRCYWSGSLLDPTRGDPLTAEGLFRKGEDFPALDASGDMTLDPDIAVDQAIARGLPWIKGSAYILGGGAVALDSDQPHSVSQILDAASLDVQQPWGVLPDRRLWRGPVQAATLHMQPGIEGLAISREGYASDLYGRFLDSATSTYKTAHAWSQAARDRWGKVERTLGSLLGEGAPMTLAEANAILDGYLAQGRAQIGWTSVIEAEYGDVVTVWGQPVNLNDITAGKTIRVHGLEADMADLAGASYADVPIARVEHSGDTVSIHPRGLVSPMADVLAGVQ